MMTTDTNGDPVDTPANQIRSDEWTLDLLGNWVGASAGTGPPGRFTLADLDGTGGLDTRALTHSVNAQNKITQISTSDNAGTPQAVTPRYDAAGNLVFDGTYFYQ